MTFKSDMAEEPVPERAAEPGKEKDLPDDTASVLEVWWTPRTAAMLADQLRLAFVHVVCGGLVVVGASFSARRIERLFDREVIVGCLAVV